MNNTTCAWIEDDICRCCLIKTILDGDQVLYCDRDEFDMKNCEKYSEVIINDL